MVDSQGDVGLGSDVAYGPDGLALISYVDSTNGALKAAHCNDVACTAAVRSTIDGSGNVAGNTSIAFGPDGRGLISYQAGSSIKVAHCADVVCSAATLSTVDGVGTLAYGTAIAVGTDGLAVVAYRDPTNNALKMAHCLDADCASATLTAYPGRAGLRPSLTIGGDGLPLVACDNEVDLHVGHCSNQACTAATFVTIQSGPLLPSFNSFYDGSLATRSDGLGMVAFTHRHVDIVSESYGTSVARCANAACSSLTPAPPFLGMNAQFDPALALMPGDLPVIAEYAGAQQRLRVSRCPDAACVSPYIDVLDTPGTGWQPAVAVSPAGIGLVTYYDFVNHDLKAAYMDGSAPSQISIGDVTVLEGSTGTTGAVFQLQQTGTGGASVDFATGGGTATAGIDYVATSGTVVFPPGTSTRTVTVQVIGDLTVEANETFFITLSNPQGAQIGDGLGQGTIANDDSSEISIGDVAQVETNSGTTTATLQVHQTGGGAASVQYVTGGGSATPGVDYVAGSGTVIFPAGSTTQTITVPIIGDVIVEADETFLVTLSNPVGATILDGTGECTIVDDDVATLPVVTELAHGSRHRDDLAPDPGPVADVDHFRMAQAPYSSYEVVADATSGDIQPIELTRTAADGTTVLQTATADGAGFSVSLRWQTSSLPVMNQFVRVRSGGCGTDCGPDDVYHLRAYETTLSAARFNNSGSQTTVLLLQNPTNAPVDAAIHFWSPAGALLATHLVTPPLPAKATLALITTQVPGLAGVGGTVTVSHTAPYGALSGKTVALEASTGFSFDTPLQPKSR